MDTWLEAIDFVLDIASNKKWLAQESFFLLYTLFTDLCFPRDQLLYANVLIAKLQSRSLLRTPGGVAIWLAVQSLYPEVALPDGVWHHSDPLNHKERKSLGIILMEATFPISSLDDGQISQQSGRWSPSIHFAWDVVMAQLSIEAPMSSSAQDKESRISFGDLWTASAEGKGRYNDQLLAKLNQRFFSLQTHLKRRSIEVLCSSSLVSLRCVQKTLRVCSRKISCVAL